MSRCKCIDCVYYNSSGKNHKTCNKDTELYVFGVDLPGKCKYFKGKVNNGNAVR